MAREHASPAAFAQRACRRVARNREHSEIQLRRRTNAVLIKKEYIDFMYELRNGCRRSLYFMSSIRTPVGPGAF